jgi:serine/threonine protein phosphatase PrpC
MKAAWKSDQGKVRENNEDAVLVDAPRGIFLLADGMGGHRGGEVASGLAVRTVHDFLRERVDQASGEEMPRLLAEALATAHSSVYKRGMGNPELEGMGTTLEILIIRERQAHICHVGDSRLYLFREGIIAQVTQDDNMAAYLVTHKQVAPADVPPHYRNILTQAVGVSGELIPEIRTLDLVPEDLILLCSDGLTAMLADRDIEGIVACGRADLDSAVTALVDETNSRGGHDNISVVLVAPELASPPPPLLLTG